jgi:hypothetical protein
MKGKNMRLSGIGFLMSCASLALITTIAQAADSPRPLEAAWKAAMMDFEGVLTDEQHTTINSIA